MADDPADDAAAGGDVAGPLEARRVSGVDGWRGAVHGALLRFEVDCARPEEFHGTVTRRRLGDTSLVAMTSRPHHATRAPEHIDEATRPDLLLSVQLAGWAEFRQDGRRARLRPGDMAFYDSTRAVEITSGEGYRSLCFRFPRAVVDAGLPVGDLTATLLDGAHGLTPALAGLLTGLHGGIERAGQDGPGTRALVATARHAADLASTLFDDELTRRGLSGPREPHAVLRERVDRYIDEHLAEPDLSPGAIAAALFVSTRHLHALLADDGRTVAGTVRRRRLERCLLDLADPRSASRPVSAIARRWGFVNATRFGQLVKRETGATPVAYRRAMLRGAR